MQCFTCCLSNGFEMSLVKGNPVYPIWEQQIRRSACESVQSYQCFCCSLYRYQGHCTWSIIANSLTPRLRLVSLARQACSRHTRP